jgi:hypothetical protein
VVAGSFNGLLVGVDDVFHGLLGYDRVENRTGANPRRRFKTHVQMEDAMRVWFRIIGLVSVAILWISCASGSGNTGEGTAPPSVDVRIGADAGAAATHDVTIEALEAGQTEYSIESDGGHVYKVQLDSAQVEDLLDGSTIVADGTDAAGQSETIRIGVSKPSKKKLFGW